jgi:hypothetical protein
MVPSIRPSSSTQPQEPGAPSSRDCSSSKSHLDPEEQNQIRRTNPVTLRNTHSLQDRTGACYFSQMETLAAEHSEPNPILHGPT